MNILETCYRIINKYNRATQNPRRYGTDDLLYPAEVHALELIGSQQDTTATLLAQKLGVTKGAVSQTTSRLLQKKLIEKLPSPRRKNEWFLQLTQAGETVFHYHRRLHTGMLAKVEEQLSTLPPESLRAFEKITAIIDSSLDELQGGNEA